MGDDRSKLDAGDLYRDHADVVRRVLRRYGAPPEDLEDLIQEVFLVAHRKGGFEVRDAKPSTWLSAIAVRVASDRRRRRDRRLQKEQADTSQVVRSEDVGESPRVAAEVKERLRRVRRALRQLSPPKRTVFVLYEMEGRSCDEIAKALHVPVGTVYSRLHDARRRFLAAYDTSDAARPLAIESTHGASE